MGRHLQTGWIGVLVLVIPMMVFWIAAPRAAESYLNRPATSVSSVMVPTESEIPVEVSPTLVSRIPNSYEVVTYTGDQVMQWAHTRSPEAGLIETEIDAMMRNLDPKDPDACCSARLIRDVLSEVALARRSDDAAHAIVAYHKLIAATEAHAKVDEAILVQDRLIAMADEAERLELPDGDPLRLRQSRLELLDLKSQQRFNAFKLRQELSRLTGRPEAEVANAIMTDPMPTMAPDVVAGLAVETAIAQRHDLLAVSVLCRQLRSCNLDAARLLMGVVSPGVGLSLATAAKGLFSCLKEDHSDDDKHARKRQCKQLYDSLSIVIRNETLQAVLDVRAAGARLKLIDQQITIALKRLQQTQGAIRIDESVPGSDMLIELEIAVLEGKRIAIQKDLVLAIDGLDHARSMPLSARSSL